MNWPLLLLAVFVGLGVRSGGSGRRPYVLAAVATAAVLGYEYLGLGRLP